MKTINIPKEIETALDDGAALYFSISGGKDSQAMLHRLAPIAQARGWQCYTIHADLGRAEWPQTPGEVEKQASSFGLSLQVIHRPQGDMVQEIEDRMHKLVGSGKPFWPSTAARYCTSDQKRGQADKVYRQHQIIISAEGIRADESPNRGKKSQVSIRKQITAKRLQKMSVSKALAARADGERVGINWFPVFDFSLDDVWQAIGSSSEDIKKRRKLYKNGREAEALDGWPGHPAYVFGNDRLSCALCVMASTNDLINGAHHNQWLYKKYRSMELQGGFTFKHKHSLAGIVGDELAEFVALTDWQILQEQQPELATELMARASSHQTNRQILTGMSLLASVTISDHDNYSLIDEFFANALRHLQETNHEL